MLLLLGSGFPVPEQAIESHSLYIQELEIGYHRTYNLLVRYVEKLGEPAIMSLADFELFLEGGDGVVGHEEVLRDHGMAGRISAVLLFQSVVHATPIHVLVQFDRLLGLN